MKDSYIISIIWFFLKQWTTGDEVVQKDVPIDRYKSNQLKYAWPV